MTNRTVTVIGGGIAGCSVAYFLTESGYDVQILEKNEIGGMLSEIEFSDGSHCDSAPHVLFFDRSDAPAKRLFSKFTDLDPFDPYAKTYPTGWLSDPHDYPVSRRNAERWDDAATLKREIDDATSTPEGQTFDEFVTAQVGVKMYQRYFKSYTAKQWGVSPSEIVGDWFDYKIDFVDDETPFFPDTEAYYPRRKYSDVLKEMVGDCSVVYEGATGLQTSDTGVTAVETETGTLESDVFVNTVDPAYLVSDPDQYRYRSMIIVGVRATLDDDVFPSEVWWGYFPNDYEFTRLTEYGFTPWSFDDQTLLTFEYPCFTDDRLWRRDYAWFADRVGRFLAEQGIEACVEEIVLRRLPRAYPLPVEADIRAFHRTNDRLKRFKNLYNIGRVATYEYVWVRDIVEAAADTASRIESRPNETT